MRLLRARNEISHIDKNIKWTYDEFNSFIKGIPEFLPPELQLDCYYSKEVGQIETLVDIEEYSEIEFEFFNSKFNSKGNLDLNEMIFYIDENPIFVIKGPLNLMVTRPFGLTPGRHRIKFVHKLNSDNPDHLVCVGFRNLKIWKGKEVNAIINTNKPPRPNVELASQKVLRGFTVFQEHVQQDTIIEFTASLDPIHYLEFIRNYRKIFYAIDELSICYRGVFPSKVDVANLGNSLYVVALEMYCDQSVGIGFSEYIGPIRAR